MTEYQNGRVSLQVLAHSRTSTLRDCAAKYGYRYADGLRPKVDDSAVQIRGRGMHEGLEAGYLRWQAMRTGEVELASNPTAIRVDALAACDKAHDEALAALLTARESGAPVEQVDEMRVGLEETHEGDRWALGHFFDVIVPRNYARKTPILIEHAFDVPVLDAGGRARHLRWIGVFDVVMYDERLRVLELHEAKTVGTNAGSEEHRRRIEGDPQTTSYIYALRSMQRSGQLDAAMIRFGMMSEEARAVPIGSVMVNVIRRKKPSEPKTLVDGTVSTDRRIDTLPEVYAAALADQGVPAAITKAIEACVEAERGLDEAERSGSAADILTSAAKLVRAVDVAAKRNTKAIEALEKKRAAFLLTQEKQRDLLEALRSRGDTFLAEVEHHVSERECARWRAEQWIEAERMRIIEKRPAARTRNLRYCTAPGRGCAYRSLCYSGGDPAVAAREFTTAAERETMAVVEAVEDDEPGVTPAPYTAPSWG